MMLVVLALTTGGLYFAQRKVAAAAERDLQDNFQAELSSLHNVQELRRAALAERCRVLASKPRIHAALEDNALDLLYPSAKDELRDLMQGGRASSRGSGDLASGKVLPFSEWHRGHPAAAESAGGRRTEQRGGNAVGPDEITRDAANWLPAAEHRCNG